MDEAKHLTLTLELGKCNVKLASVKHFVFTYILS